MFLQTLGLPIIWGSLDSKFAFKKPTQGWTITQGPLSRAHCFKLKKWMAAKKTNKNIWTLVMNTHEHPWAPMSTWARMSTHEQWAPINSHEFLWMFMEASCVRIKNQLAIYMLNHMSHSFKLLCLVFCYASFWCKLFFWTLFLCLCVMYCCFVLCWLCTPGSNPLLQNMVFDTYISYIYICVCVGVSQNEVSFFPRKATVLEPKKDTSCWDIPRWVCVCVCAYIYICM